MKLLFCLDCHDIVKLQLDSRSCLCGHSCGYYHKDGWHATVSGRGVAIGIHNPDFAEAVSHMRASPNITQAKAEQLGNFRAWVFWPKHAKRVQFHI